MKYAIFINDLFVDGFFKTKKAAFDAALQNYPHTDKRSIKIVTYSV